jgi:hypothetical protein
MVRIRVRKVIARVVRVGGRVSARVRVRERGVMTPLLFLFKKLPQNKNEKK